MHCPYTNGRPSIMRPSINSLMRPSRSVHPSDNRAFANAARVPRIDIERECFRAPGTDKRYITSALLSPLIPRGSSSSQRSLFNASTSLTVSAFPFDVSPFPSPFPFDVLPFPSPFPLFNGSALSWLGSTFLSDHKSGSPLLAKMRN